MIKRCDKCGQLIIKRPMRPSELARKMGFHHITVLRMIREGKIDAVNLNPASSRPSYSISAEECQRLLEKIS